MLILFSFLFWSHLSAISRLKLLSQVCFVCGSVSLLIFDGALGQYAITLTYHRGNGGAVVGASVSRAHYTLYQSSQVKSSERRGCYLKFFFFFVICYGA